MAKFSNAKLQLLLYQPNTKWFNNPLWGIYPQRFRSRISKRYLYTYIHCSIIPIAKRWKQPKCPSTWMDEEKVVYICTTECYAALKKKEIFSQATMWMNFEHIMSSEISQPQKDGYSVIPWSHSYGTSDVVKIIETERKSVITKGSGEDLLFKRYSFSFATWKSSGDLQ